MVEANQNQTSEKVVLHDPKIDRVKVKPTATERVHEEVQRVHVQPVIERQDVVQKQQVEAPTAHRKATLPHETRQVFAAGEADIEQARGAAMQRGSQAVAKQEILPEERKARFEGSEQRGAELVQEEVERHIQPHIDRTIHKHVDVELTKPVTEIIHDPPVVRDRGTIEAPAAYLDEQMRPQSADLQGAPPPMQQSSSAGQAPANDLLLAVREAVPASLESSWKGDVRWHNRTFKLAVKKHSGLLTQTHFDATLSEQDTKREWASGKHPTAQGALQDVVDKASSDLIRE